MDKEVFKKHFIELNIHYIGIPAMESKITLQVILIKPTRGVVFGVQSGSGNDYETVQKQIPASGDLSFTFTVTVKGDPIKDTLPDFSGSYVQGTRGGRFVYIDIGTYAGQSGSPWARRLKIPLTGITWNDIDALSGNAMLQAKVPGTDKDGGPNCATLKPFDGWHLRQA
ncbi:DUF5990 family protein [Flavihumibacter petaseus]|uniref:Uncharacterized protein n=1 Tax=Flavihumibacter petaseus NBRC 106054 TaxID=1220578 RepID=A0A0E9N4W2_9BACT|nr:DUF5990 family protein [Flavihumibacter petaseus]GAO44726.1 hypothetical protein FPE01S_03_07650 [Flavihumibacter petaseus NBRC 106054]